jgi:formamidopyrimidine-DNA glycosylase
MPELAEVEYYRKQWDPGLNKKVLRVATHDDKRIFRGTDLPGLKKALVGSRLIRSEARGKQMLFVFSGGAHVGIHLGMTGKMSVEKSDYSPQKHDHFVLFQSGQALVFTDMRQFGRVLFHQGKQPPEWWTGQAPAPHSQDFTFETMKEFLARRTKLSIKAALLIQEGFPGIGNWLADEILWQAGIHPRKTAPELSSREMRKLFESIKKVCTTAVEMIGVKLGDPPSTWLFHERWSKKGKCPLHKTPLSRESIGGRTTAFCQKCQR